MPRNVEIKARVDDRSLLLSRVSELATGGPFEIEQTDTFFNCENGRLKLRDFGNCTGELIFYRRADSTGPTDSFYLRSATTAPSELREVLTQAYGVSGEVHKRRTVFMIGRTRVHIDDVTGLGNYMELEVVLAEGEPARYGEREAQQLMQELGIHHGALVRTAYVDLLRP